MKNIFTKIRKEFDHRTRLGIMSMLMVNEWVGFKTFKETMNLEDGTLASHLKKLEANEFIKIKKEFIGRKPQTSYSVTEIGRKAFTDHLDALEEIIRQSK